MAADPYAARDGIDHMAAGTLANMRPSPEVLHMVPETMTESEPVPIAEAAYGISYATHASMKTAVRRINTWRSGRRDCVGDEETEEAIGWNHAYCADG